jgi:hypothetical protein
MDGRRCLSSLNPQPGTDEAAFILRGDAPPHCPWLFVAGSNIIERPFDFGLFADQR